MSVKLMAMVWDSGLPKNMKMTLLAYADHANDDGTSIYPGEERMAEKTSDSPGNVRRVTRLLIADGVLTRTGHGRRGHRATYMIDVEALAAHIARHSTALIAARGGDDRRASDPDRVAPTHGQARGGATPTHQEPPIPEPSGTGDVHIDDLDLSHLPVMHDGDTVRIEDGIAVVEVVDPSTGAVILSPAAYATAMKDALVDAMGWRPSELGPRQWAKVEAAAAELRAVHADPAEVAARVRVYRVNFNGATMTPNAIASNWADLAKVRAPIPTRDIERAAVRQATRDAIRER